jgi:hypothetical protein
MSSKTSLLLIEKSPESSVITNFGIQISFKQLKIMEILPSITISKIKKGRKKLRKIIVHLIFFFRDTCFIFMSSKTSLLLIEKSPESSVITNFGIQISFKQLNSGSSVSPGIY